MNNVTNVGDSELSVFAAISSEDCLEFAFHGVKFCRVILIDVMTLSLITAES